MNTVCGAFVVCMYASIALPLLCLYRCFWWLQLLLRFCKHSLTFVVDLPRHFFFIFISVRACVYLYECWLVGRFVCMCVSVCVSCMLKIHKCWRLMKYTGSLKWNACPLCVSVVSVWNLQFDKTVDFSPTNIFRTSSESAQWRIKWYTDENKLNKKKVHKKSKKKTFIGEFMVQKIKFSNDFIIVSNDVHMETVQCWILKP